MPSSLPLLRKTHITTERPPFERIALVLQGGGALGAYQGGVYQALAEANLHPDWVAGISIGAINSALIAWQSAGKACREIAGILGNRQQLSGGNTLFSGGKARRRVRPQHRQSAALIQHAPLRRARFLQTPSAAAFLYPSMSPVAMSYYDTIPLKATLERLVDFDLINAGATRFSVGTVNVRSSNFVYFDNAADQIGPQHVMASGSLPSGFPATEIRENSTGTAASSPTRRCNGC